LALGRGFGVRVPVGRAAIPALLGLSLTAATVARADLSLKFAWHPISMVLATQLLMPLASEVIIARQEEPLPKRGKYGMVHGCVMLLALAVAGIGVQAIYSNKPAGFPGVHFQTLHALCGLAALAAMLAASGRAEVRNLQLKQMIAPRWSDKLHRQAGNISVSLSTVAVLTGLYNRLPLVDWSSMSLLGSTSWFAMGGWSYATHGSAATVAWLVLALVALLFPIRRQRAKKS
jgi:hypothetical protein